jgi:hypothetical protein
MEIPVVSTTWKEGRVFDLWMIVHFLGGLTGGFSNVFFALSARSVYLIGIGMMMAWELVEYAAGIREATENRLLDVVIGLAGVFVALDVAARFGTTVEYGAFVACGLAFGIGGLIGWLAHRRRVANEEQEEPAEEQAG